jgi:hypothetical protein
MSARLARNRVRMVVQGHAGRRSGNYRTGCLSPHAEGEVTA